MPNEVTVKIKVEDGEARIKLKLLEEEAKREGEKAGRGFADNFRRHMGRLGKGAGFGAGGFGALLGIGSVAGMLGPLGALTAGVAAFGAVAMPVLTQVGGAASKLNTAQQQLANATTASQRKAALHAEAQATLGLSAAQKAIVPGMVRFQNAMQDLQDKFTPLVGKVVDLAGRLLTALMPALNRLIPAGEKIIESFIKPFISLASSPAFNQLIKQMAQLAVQAGSVLGPAVISLVKALMQLFVQVGPAGIQILQVLLPLIVQIVTDLTPVLVILAKVTAATLNWLQANHLLIPALALLTAGIATALIVIESTSAPIWLIVAAVVAVVVAIVELVKHWKTVWATIVHIVDDAVHWIEKHWRGIVEILTGPIGFAVVWIIDHWNMITAIPGKVVSAVARAWGGIYNAIVSPVWNAVTTVFDYFNQIINFAASIPSKIGHFLGSVGSGALHMLGFEHGGIVGAATGGNRSGMVMVGEHGRELVSLPTGSKVHSNPDTERMMGQGGGGGQVTVSFDFGGAGTDELVKLLRGAIRIKGGNVQTVLGH